MVLRPKFLIKQLLIKERVISLNTQKHKQTLRMNLPSYDVLFSSLVGVYIPFSGRGRQDLALIVISSICKITFIGEVFYPRYRQMGLRNSLLQLAYICLQQ